MPRAPGQLVGTPSSVRSKADRKIVSCEQNLSGVDFERDVIHLDIWILHSYDKHLWNTICVSGIECKYLHLKLEIVTCQISLYLYKFKALPYRQVYHVLT
jgi:hypothetical protein